MDVDDRWHVSFTKITKNWERIGCRWIVDSLEVNPSYNLSYRKMARNRGQKATNGPKKDTKKVENSNQQFNLMNGNSTRTSTTTRQSKYQSSGYTFGM